MSAPTSPLHGPKRPMPTNERLGTDDRDALQNPNLADRMGLLAFRLADVGRSEEALKAAQGSSRRIWQAQRYAGTPRRVNLAGVRGKIRRNKSRNTALSRLTNPTSTAASGKKSLKVLGRLAKKRAMPQAI